jgi:sulfate/thiosulfate transport system ATP-binding protein
VVADLSRYRPVSVDRGFAGVVSRKGFAMAIEVRGVSKSFGSQPVLRDVSVEVAAGSLTALLGPSGGGKSTLLRVIAGLETPDSGSVIISGVDATGLTPQRRNVGFVFQHYAAFKHMTVFDNVAFGLEIRKKPKAEIKRRVYELLDLVHLEQFAHRYPGQLSGGQRQRMALARALAVEPGVLLLDEPFGALDAQVRKELRVWLRRLHDDVHVTTVFVTHDQEEAMDVADSVVLLAGGVVEQVGAPQDIYDQPANAFVMGFLGATTYLDGAMIRPHDITVSAVDAPGWVSARVRRMVRLGFEVRVEMTAEGTGADVWAQVTREQADALAVTPGSTVYLAARPEAVRIPSERERISV